MTQLPVRTVKQMVLDHLTQMIDIQRYLKSQAEKVSDKVLINQAIWTLEDVVAYVEDLPDA